MQQTLNSFFEIISNYIESNEKGTNKLIDYKSPEKLKELIEFEVQDKGLSFNETLKIIGQYLEFSVNTGNHQFFNQFYAGFNLPAFMGEIVTALTNTSMYTYEVAPVATIIETEIIRKMNKIIGFDNGDGIFVTGGSNANLIAMFSARNKAFPNTKKEGIYNMPKLSAFVSEESHYSFENNVNLMG